MAGTEGAGRAWWPRSDSKYGPSVAGTEGPRTRPFNGRTASENWENGSHTICSTLTREVAWPVPPCGSRSSRLCCRLVCSLTESLLNVLQQSADVDALRTQFLAGAAGLACRSRWIRAGCGRDSGTASHCCPERPLPRCTARSSPGCHTVRAGQTVAALGAGDGRQFSYCSWTRRITARLRPAYPTPPRRAVSIFSCTCTIADMPLRTSDTSGLSHSHRRATSAGRYPASCQISRTACGRIRQRAAKQRLHDHDSEPFCGGVLQARRARLHVLVDEVVLDLAETPVVGIHNVLEHRRSCRERKANLADPPVALSPLGPVRWPPVPASTASCPAADNAASRSRCGRSAAWQAVRSESGRDPRPASPSTPGTWWPHTPSTDSRPGAPCRPRSRCHHRGTRTPCRRSSLLGRSRSAACRSPHAHPPRVSSP